MSRLHLVSQSVCLTAADVWTRDNEVQFLSVSTHYRPAGRPALSPVFEMLSTSQEICGEER